MKNWTRSVLPVLAVATGMLLSGTSVAAETGTGNPAGGTPTSASSMYWMLRSGLPLPAAHVLQAQIDEQIATYGGVQISPYEVAYNGGDPIMVFANPLTGELPTASADRAESSAGFGSGSSSGTGQFAQAQLAPLTTSYRYGCPYTSTNGWDCFYQNGSFNDYSCLGGSPCGDGGRMLQFESCGTQSLATYGFADMTSSWVNNTSSYVTVYNSSHTELWSEGPGAASTGVGGANDQAYSFWIIC